MATHAAAAQRAAKENRKKQSAPAISPPKRPHVPSHLQHIFRHKHDDAQKKQGEEEEKEVHVRSLPFQHEVNAAYQGNVVQLSVAFLIFLNFVISGISAQIHPQKGTPVGNIFLIFEWFFGLVFAVELIWNLYGSWYVEFFTSGWNWFDLIIVIISLLALTLDGLPGIAILRLFRAFRVFRLFKRIQSLKMIIEGVLASLPGVLNAFLVLGILMGIWSIMGYEFFGEAADQEFGSFVRGFFTMWQVMTMDSWASGIARPLIFDHNKIVAVPFFMSFTFIAGIVMTNVVVAILLDKYLEVTSDQKNRDNKHEDEQAAAEAPAGGTPERHSKGPSRDGKEQTPSQPQSPALAAPATAPSTMMATTMVVMEPMGSTNGLLIPIAAPPSPAQEYTLKRPNEEDSDETTRQIAAQLQLLSRRQLAHVIRLASEQILALEGNGCSQQKGSQNPLHV